MTKTKKTESTQQDRIDSFRGTDVASRPDTPLEIMISRALDHELEWYFTHAEAALHRRSVFILPSYAAVPLCASQATEETIRARALELAGSVKGCLSRLPGKHAEILRAAYTPRTWPGTVEKAFGAVTAIAVRVAFADDPWPSRPSRTGLERAAAVRLGAAITSKRVAVGRLRDQAERLFGGAILAYARARALDSNATEGR